MSAPAMAVPVTAEALRAIMPNLRADVAVLLAGLADAAAEADLSTPQRMAAFLAQVAHESGEFRWMEELGHRSPVKNCKVCEDVGAAGNLMGMGVFPGHAAGAQYEGRIALGNTMAGDGARYKGRGPIQLTGRANYRAAGKALGLPLEEQPELAARLDVGLRVAAWYWRTRKCNAPADVGDFREVTRRINGGYTGLERRQAYFSNALRALGVE